MNAMRLHVQRLVDRSRDISAKNERLRVTKEDILSLLLNLFAIKRSAEATKKQLEDIYVQYLHWFSCEIFFSA